MALEIRELIIRTTISDQKNLQLNTKITEGEVNAIKREILNECIDTIKEELNKNKNR